MSGSVDYIDFRILVNDRTVFGIDGDPPLFLLFVGIHHAFGQFLMRLKSAALPQDLVDQCGLAVVDMRDDGNGSKFHKDKF